MRKCSLHNERSHSGGSTSFCSGPHIIPIIYFIRIYDLDYHIFSDDTQLYVSFTLTDFLEAKFRVDSSVYGGDMLLDKLKRT